MTTLSLSQTKTFDFETNNVEQMSLATLMLTQRENGPDRKPLRGIYHFQVIQRIVDMCEKYHLNYEVEEIFAAQNKNKMYPGVTILEDLEETYGEKSVESHILRRIFATIRIKDFETDELTTTLAIACHQEGIQIAIGPCVNVCHNQCILGPERSISNYGNGKNNPSMDEMFEKVDEWLRDFETQMNEDREKILRLKNKKVTELDIYTIIGLLTSLRVAHDSKDKRLSSKVDTYPLNQSQITVFTEEILKKLQTKPVLSAWDIYNVATELYKPEKSEIPTLIPQNLSFAETLIQFCNKFENQYNN